MLVHESLLLECFYHACGESFVVFASIAAIAVTAWVHDYANVRRK